MRPRLICLVLLSLLSITTASAQPGPTVLVLYDMEGLSQVGRESYTDADTPDYAQGRRWLTEDVNAAIRGLKAGGAGKIWVVDGHGSGNTKEPDILLDQLDPAAEFNFRPYQFDQYSSGIEPTFDAIICIGMHARANTNGFLAHTYNSDIAYRVNGIDFSETHIVAASAARFGIPVIMVSGDDVLGEQLKPDFPDMEYAVGKIARSRALAEPLPPAEAHRRIQQAAQRALEKFREGKYRAYYVRPPFEFELSFQNQAQRDGAARSPLVTKSGDLAVRYLAPTFVDGYEYSKLLMPLASDRMQLLVALLQRDPEGKRLLEEWQELILQRWLEPEKAPAWARELPGAQTKPRWWGSN